MSKPRLLTSPQVARRLGRSARTVHRLVASGELVPALKLDGPNGAFLFDPSAVEELALRRGTESDTSAPDSRQLVASP